MPGLFLVDTSIWIFALCRGSSPGVLNRLDDLRRRDLVATCGLIKLELLGGTRSDAEFTRLRSRLGGLRQLDLVELDWTDAARLAFDLSRAGITVPLTDALLATLAIRTDLTLLHADNEFDRISQHSRLRSEDLAPRLRER